MSQTKTVIIIPVYNESFIIRKVIRSIKNEGFGNIIVIDDGSTDDTYTEICKESVYVFRHAINRGKGAALKTGFKAALLLRAKYIVTIDGDGQHDPQDIKVLIDTLKAGYDVALGIRNISPTQMPLARVVGNRLANLLTLILFGIRPTDSQSGLRAYTQKALRQIAIYHDGYEIETEIFREIKKNQLKSLEIPIKNIYTPYSLNKSTKQSFLTGIKTLMKLSMNPY